MLKQYILNEDESQVVQQISLVVHKTAQYGHKPIL